MKRALLTLKPESGQLESLSSQEKEKLEIELKNKLEAL